MPQKTRKKIQKRRRNTRRNRRSVVSPRSSAATSKRRTAWAAGSECPLFMCFVTLIQDQDSGGPGLKVHGPYPPHVHRGAGRVTRTRIEKFRVRDGRRTKNFECESHRNRQGGNGGNQCGCDTRL